MNVIFSVYNFCGGNFYVNMTQASIIWEEGLSI